MSNASKEAEGVVTRGQGNAGTTATVTKTVTKAVAVTPVAVTVATRGGLSTTPPATAGNFDRTVATSLGK